MRINHVWGCLELVNTISNKWPWIRSNKAAILRHSQAKIMIGSTEYVVYLLQCKDGCSPCNEMQKTRIRHNDLRELIAILLSNVYKDVEIKLKMLLVTGEIFLNRTANTRTEAGLDIRSWGFWVRGSTSIFQYMGIWPKR